MPTDDAVIDRGDTIVADEKPVAPPADTDVDNLAEDLLNKGEDEDKLEDPPRDDHGKFTKKGEDNRIPKDRFDEAVNKERAAREAAERRAEEAEAKLKQESRSDEVAKMESDIESLEVKHVKLINDGEHEEAAKVMKEIRMSVRKIADMENNEKLTRATTQAVEQVRMDATIARIEADYSVLNEESADYDPDFVDLVLAEQARLIRAERMPPSRALATAADKIMNKLKPAAKADDPAPKKGLDAARTADRKADQVAKNLDTASRQPAKASSAGADSDKFGQKDALPDIDKLTAEELAALPASVKAKMRGDEL